MTIREQLLDAKNCINADDYYTADTLVNDVYEMYATNSIILDADTENLMFCLLDVISKHFETMNTLRQNTKQNDDIFSVFDS